MLIARQGEAFDSTDYIYELKMDGFRCLAYLEPGMVDLIIPGLRPTLVAVQPTPTALQHI